MDILSQVEMIARENEAFRSGVTAKALMEAAGEAMAGRIIALYPHAQEFLVLVGKGNNGGDGFVVARHLVLSGRHVRVVLTASEGEPGTLPAVVLESLRQSAPDLRIELWRDDFPFPGSDGVVIDALLGVQARGVLRGTLAGIVSELNAARAKNFFRTIALDLPSGLAAYEVGDAPLDRNAAVVADVTIAVGFAKVALSRESLAPWVGRLDVVPWSSVVAEPMPRQILVGHELTGLLPRRNALSHKNNFGSLAIVAGSPGFTGAPVLCAQAAQSMGVGLLSVVTRADAYEVVAAQAPPEAMVSGWPENDEVPAVVRNASAIVIGPGLGADQETVKLLNAVLSLGYPLLIDADGLNALAQNPDLLHEAKGPVVLTPHPGEMTRLIGRKFSLDEREAAARAFTDRYNVTLVLKGTRTLIVARGEPIFINTTGNPGLSTGGSGDTLSGVIGALLTQGLKPMDAARLGVWLHGHAADLILGERGCEEGITPTMVSAHLGAALVSLRAQAVAAPGLLERAKDYL
jgi:NAD(P)H-hydrate epimerase